MMNKEHSAVDIFAVIDFALAGLHALCILLMIAVLVYGIFFSGDTEEEISQGVRGFLIVTIPLLLGFGIFFSAGLGLLKRKLWGYYVHIVAAVLSFFTLVLLLYSVICFVFIFKPGFRSEFIPADGAEAQIKD